MASRVIIDGISPDGLFAKFTQPKAFRDRVRETRFKQDWRMPGWMYEILQLGWNGEGDPLKWLAMAMQSFKGPKYQRGMLSGMGVKRAILGGGGGGGVSLTNHSLSSTDTGNLVTCRVVFQSDGTLVHNDDGTLTDVAAGEWHTDEPSTTGADYEVRYTSASKTGDAYGTPAAAGDTWIRTDADRSWGHAIIAKAAPDSRNSSATFELGDNGTSSADDSATITLQAIN